MRKIIFLTFVVVLAITPQISAIQIEVPDIVKRSFGCSIELSGEVKVTYPIMHLPIGEKSFIMYLSIQFIDGSNVKVIVDREVFNFDSGGKIHIIGFFGIYTANESDNGKKFVNLNGTAVYVKIKAEPNYDVDDSYLPIVKSLDNIG
jgi:hypothetical protein